MPTFSKDKDTVRAYIEKQEQESRHLEKYTYLSKFNSHYI